MKSYPSRLFSDMNRGLLMGDFSVNIQRFAVQFVPFMIAVVFHEWAHGFIAHRWGDSTAKDEGRLTLNPLAHIDPMGTVLFPAINMITGIPLLIGWAKPVPINPTRFRKYRPGLFWVSIAGPAMNFLIAFLCACVFVAMIKFVPHDFYLFDPLVAMARVGVSLNFWLALFNLIPLPPLDGSKIIQSFLSYNATQKYETLAAYSFYIFIALLLTGALSVLMYPVNVLTSITLGIAGLIFGLGGIM